MTLALGDMFYTFLSLQLLQPVEHFQSQHEPAHPARPGQPNPHGDRNKGKHVHYQ